MGKRLKDCRKNKGVSQKIVAKAVGMSQTNLSELENDIYPTSSFIPMLANYYEVSALWLANGKGEKAPLSTLFLAEQKQNKYSNIGEKIALRGRVPVISFVQAGNWSETVDNLSPGIAEEWIETTLAIKRHTYALRVRGDSMVNTSGGRHSFPEGAIIIVEPEEEAKNGSYVIVRQNGSDATFKQLVIDGGQTYLKPLNDRYPIMPMLPDAVICGVVKKMEMDV